MSPDSRKLIGSSAKLFILRAVTTRQSASGGNRYGSIQDRRPAETSKPYAVPGTQRLAATEEASVIQRALGRIIAKRSPKARSDEI
jgi:hypothetical protein